MKIETKVNIPIRAGNKSAGTGTFISFEGIKDEHFAIGLGDYENVEIPTVRLHSECMTGDVFGSERCDCGEQLAEAISLISEKGGYVLYLRQEGRGIGLYNKFKAYRLQDEGFDTFEANEKLGFSHDLRDFSVAAEMLKSLGANKVMLHTNNKNKREQLKEHGIEVVDMLNTKVYKTDSNENYLKAKNEVAGHMIDLEAAV
jgi:GTP cyclohydrolase II